MYALRSRRILSMIDKEYLASLDDEIGKDVYFYHNKINDKIELFTVGCEISEWDGEKIVSLLNPDDLQENIIIFNTCAVTELAQKASEKVADRLVKIYPNKKIYFTGCGVNYDEDYYSRLGITLKNEDKFNAENYGCRKKSSDYYFRLNTHRETAVVKIQDGCYNNCAYCIIHKIRPHYTVPYEKIKKQIEALISQGRRSIQLLGTEICTYNYNGMRLTQLCEKILKDFKEIETLTLGALDPASREIDSLIELIKREPRISNNLYLCTQSCSDTILKKMNRRHNVERLRELSKMCGDKAHLIFQIIVGFPGETDELFQETVDLIKELKPIDYDTIPFSARKGTPAYDMPDKIPWETIAKRERIIYDIIKEYTFKDDYETERSFATYEKGQIDDFVKHKPRKLNDSLVYHTDIYDNDKFIELFKNILKDTNKEVVVITDFNLDRDLFDYDVNVKLLTTLLGVKVVTRININKDTLKFLSDTYWGANVFMYRLCSYLEFYFDKNLECDEADLVNLFKLSEIYSIEDINIMINKLIKSGNIKYLKSIMENFNVAI